MAGMEGRTDLVELDAISNALFDGMKTLLDGKPLEAVAPVLVVAVARALWINAEGDPGRTREMTMKFVNTLMHEIDGMLREPEEPLQ
jgi:hypothetical protein